MREVLTAYLDGDRVGWFEDDGRGVRFEFDPAWVRGAARAELSLSMPKSARVHAGAVPSNWLWGLLPDNDRVLERWASRFGVSPRNPMALLRHVGLDAAGAVQLTEVDAPSLPGDGGYEPIGADGIRDRLAELRRDPSAWLMVDEQHGRFSLAGAQPKFALALMPDDAWAVPTGRFPSTHIFKPGIHDLADSDLGEHLALDAARRLGLRAAASDVERFGDETAIVVERYDRLRITDSTIARRHQEDLVQALGRHPVDKYQTDGGPGIATVAKLLQDRSRTPAIAQASIDRFYDANLYNLVIAGSDAHGKNYSVLHGADGIDLAPLYDPQSVLGHQSIPDRAIRLAMSINGHYRTWEIQPEDIAAQAEQIGLDGPHAVDRTIRLATDAPQALRDAATVMELSAEQRRFAASLADAVATRSAAIVRRFGSPGPSGGGSIAPRFPIAPTGGAPAQPRVPRGSAEAGRFTTKEQDRPVEPLNPPPTNRSIRL